MTTSLEALVQRCEAEQLHLSGAIQSFGALIRIGTVSGTITHVSANLADIVGVEADAVLGRSRGCLPGYKGMLLGLCPVSWASVVIRNIIDRGGIKVDGLAIQGTGCILVELERSSRGFGTVSAQRLQTPLLRVPTMKTNSPAIMSC